MRGLFQTVLGHQLEVVALVENLAVDLWMELLEKARLAVLLGHQLLVHRGDLDIKVIVGQVEVGCEELGGLAVAVPCDRKRAWLVVPGDRVEVEQKGELTLAVVGKGDLARPELLPFAQLTPAFMGTAATTSPWFTMGESR
jgi:hypothetical protein